MLIRILMFGLLAAMNIPAQSQDFPSGPIPTVQPGDIRIVLPLIHRARQMHQKDDIKGAIGFAPNAYTGVNPNSNLAAVWLRTTLFLSFIEKVEALAKWRKLDNIPDAVFAVVATYPITIQEGKDTKFNVNSFVAALQNAH
jgi:hypothetical protein